MNSILCNIRRNTVVQVTKPPQSSGLARRALCSRLREALIDLQPRVGSSVVVEGYVVQVLDDGADFLPPTLDDDLDAFIASIVPGHKREPEDSTSPAPLQLGA
jgi:hypothetical protein